MNSVSSHKSELGILADPRAAVDPLNVEGESVDWLRLALRAMLRIRLAEESIGDAVRSNEVMCPTHLAIGQEAVAVGLAAPLRPTDRVFGGHRAHAQFLALGGGLFELLAEILGRVGGCSSGRGGSMHLHAPEVGLIGTVPIVGGTISLAVGAALAAKKSGGGDVSVAFFGDGAAEEGVLHESLNLAAVWNLPAIFVCENNLFSSHLHIALRQPSDRISRFALAHRIESVTVDGNDVVAVRRAASLLIESARKGRGPGFIEAVTYRWRGHVGYREDDDVGVNRGPDLPLWKERDPVKRLTEALIAAGIVTESQLGALRRQLEDELAATWERARKSAKPEPGALMDHVYAGHGRKT